MTITTQWLAFGAMGIVLFLIGILWPKGDDGADDQSAQHHKQVGGVTEEDPSRSRGAAALASTTR